MNTAGRVQAAVRRELSRRRFIQTSAAAGAVLSLAPLARRAYASVPADEFVTWSAAHVAKMIRDKQLTAVDAVTMCYARIDAVNPKTNAVVATNRIDISSFRGARMSQNDFEHGETAFQEPSLGENDGGT